MQGVKRIVCLANSRKLRGRCVAGREWDDGQIGPWIRPVSDRENQEVSEYERQYPDGSDPRVLDILDVPVLGPIPTNHQRENWLLDPEYYWERVGNLSWADLPSFVDSPIAPLWVDGYSTYHGLNDEIPLDTIDSLSNSLTLIHVDALQMSVFKPGEAFGNTKRRVQGIFEHAGVAYRLWITDPAIEREYLARPDGQYHSGESFLTISLGEPFNESCYKLIATVFTNRRGIRP